MAIRVLSLALVAALAGCLPPRAAVSQAPGPDSATAQPATIDPTEVSTFSYEPPVPSYEPLPEESFPTFAVTKPEIRDRSFDWGNEIYPRFDAYDAATTNSELKAAAAEILSGSKDLQRWLVGHTGFDPVYEEPMSLWRKAVDLLASGAADVVRGVDRGDPSLIRKGKRRIQTARDVMSSSEFLGAWGPLVIH